MPSMKDKMSNKHKLDRTLIKVVENSSSEGEESEHELSHYVNDRVKLMKQVLKIIKPKKIKSMAPDCMKNLDNEEINSMLLEELLGISNKRLKYIFAGQNVDEDTSSSTDPEEETKPVDVISLDDITDDDFVIEIDSSNEESTKHKRHHNVKEEPLEERTKKIKKEKTGKIHKKRNSSEKKNEKTEEENLMSVLELLELQARARAIRSQLALEASKKSQEVPQDKLKDQKGNADKVDGDEDDDAIIIESPRLDEIVITSSESEDNDSHSQAKSYDGSKEKDPLKIGNEQSKKVTICGDIECHTSQNNNKNTGVLEKTRQESITHCESESNSDKSRYATGGDEIAPSASNELTSSEEHENKQMNIVDEESEKVDHQPANQEGLIISIDDDDMQAIDNE